MISLTELTSVSISAVESVADLIRSGVDADVSIETKSSPSDFVTEIDRTAERCIVEHILARVPDSTIVGEEGGVQGDGVVRWYVDPIDGTGNFAAGLPYFSTSVGVAVNGSLVGGAVHDPLRRETFAYTDDGVSLNGCTLSPSTPTDKGPGIILTSAITQLARHAPDLAGRVASLAPSNHVHRDPGSFALQLSHLASGRASIAFELDASPWDICAGVALLRAANCQFVPLADADEQDGPWASRMFVAARAGVEIGPIVEVLLAVQDVLGELPSLQLHAALASVLET